MDPCATCGEPFKTAIGWKWNPDTQEKEEGEYISEPYAVLADETIHHVRCVDVGD